MPLHAPSRLLAIASFGLTALAPAHAQSAAPRADGGSRISAVRLYPGSATVERVLRVALDGAAELHFLRSGRWQPRSKVLYDALAQDDPDAGAELRAVLHSWSGADLTERARTLVEHLAGVRGFFAWASKPEEVST